jgi:hypothetical protein
MVMYVHEPSLIIVLTRGKTVAGTMIEFCNRLEALLNRNHFEAAFIKKEMELAGEGYIIGKTNSKSILASMNAITKNIEFRCSTFFNYESINSDAMEDAFMEWLTYDASKPKGFKCTFDYWKEKGLIKL